MKWAENAKDAVMAEAKEYIGSFERGKPHGRGKMLMKNGKVIKDQFVMGMCSLNLCLNEFGSLQSSGQKSERSCLIF